MRKPGINRHLGTAVKVTAGVVSTATAAVTIFGFARSYGLVGAPAPAALTVGSLGVNWIGLAPSVDTATAVGDTVRFAATITDQNGTALFGATVHWTSDDSTIAQPIGGGRVIARHPGTAIIIAIAGREVARSHVVVRQRVATVHLEHDSALTFAEDESHRFAVRSLDARGNPVLGRHAMWTASDSAVVSIDSAGVAVGRGEGRADIGVDVDGVGTRVPILIVPMPGGIEPVSGATQRAVVGAALAQPVAVRLVSTHGKPIGGATIRFRTSEGLGRAEPAMSTTDQRGIARTSWTLGPLPGRQRLVATAERLDSAAVVIAEAEPVAANTRIVALVDSLRGTAGQPLADTVGIRATDSVGRALGDVPVMWSADDRGRVTGLSERTDSLGQAHALWTLGPSSGVQRVRVQLGSGRTVPAFVMRARATSIAGLATAPSTKNTTASHDRKSSQRRTPKRRSGSQ